MAILLFVLQFVQVNIKETFKPVLLSPCEGPNVLIFNPFFSGLLSWPAKQPWNTEENNLTGIR